MSLVMHPGIAAAVKKAWGALPFGTIVHQPIPRMSDEAASCIVREARPTTKRGREVAREGAWWLHPTKGWRRG